MQLGSLGLGVVRPAQTAVLGGTFWQQVVNLAAPVTDPEMNVRVNPHVIPGMVQAESISFFTGLTMCNFAFFSGLIDAQFWAGSA